MITQWARFLFLGKLKLERMKERNNSSIPNGDGGSGGVGGSYSCLLFSLLLFWRKNIDKYICLKSPVHYIMLCLNECVKHFTKTNLNFHAILMVSSQTDSDRRHVICDLLHSFIKIKMDNQSGNYQINRKERKTFSIHKNSFFAAFLGKEFIWLKRNFAILPFRFFPFFLFSL